MINGIDKIHNRQLARLLGHLEDSGRANPVLFEDIRRAFHWTFADIREELKGLRKDKQNERPKTD